MWGHSASANPGQVASEMAQQVEALAVDPNNLSSVPKIHTGKRERLTQVVL